VRADGHTGSARSQSQTRVSTLELFFNLVFVFTITHLARLHADE
jgi:low temperature requirement protein LtrA